VAAGGFLDYQPAAGVEVLVRSLFATYSAAASSFGLYDGLNWANTYIPAPASTGDLNTAQDACNVYIFINNTNYLRFYNGDTVNATVMGFSGIQIK
jgi:hypothetical protein